MSDQAIAGQQPRPDFDLLTATPALVGNAIRKFGTAVIRGGLEAELIDQLKATVEFGFLLQDQAVQSGELDKSDRAVLDDRLGVNSFAKLPGGAAQLQQIVQHCLMHLIQGYLGPKLQLMLHRSVIRRQKPSRTTSHTPFHQDGGFLERGRPIVVCWIALDRCGVDAPGLEVVTDGIAELLPITGRPSGAAYDSIELDEETMVARFGHEKLWHPEFHAGDVCLLTEHAIHRTYVRPTMTGTRRTLLLRFTCDAAQAVA